MTACLFLHSLCTRWIASSKARSKTVFGHLKRFNRIQFLSQEFAFAFAGVSVQPAKFCFSRFLCVLLDNFYHFLFSCYCGQQGEVACLCNLRKIPAHIVQTADPWFAFYFRTLHLSLNCNKNKQYLNEEGVEKVHFFKVLNASSFFSFLGCPKSPNGGCPSIFLGLAS